MSSERLTRIVTDENNYYYQEFTSETFKCISNLTHRSNFWNNYQTFLRQVQIPFESLCMEIEQKIKKDFLDIPIAKKTVESSFKLWLTQEEFLDTSEGILVGCFDGWSEDLHGFYCSFYFVIQLNCESISYLFRIFQEDWDKKYILNKNCQTLSEQLAYRLNARLNQEYFGIYYAISEESDRIENLSQLVNISPEYLIGGQKNIKISSLIDSKQYEKLELNNDYKFMIFEGFKDFLILLLLITSDDPMPDINKICNIDWYDNNDSIEHFSEDIDTEEIYLEETTLNHHIKTLKRKKQIIFQGSPGTGKTYLAKHIAQHLTSSGDGFFELIQFHLTYSYEDFIQGIRPQNSPDGNLEYSLIAGRFLDFCKKAANCQDICILIIDEINRSNLSQVFGELMYLLEYREEEINLAGSNQPFKIPENVYIIGTMNTADRSIALVDHALRRRFAFITIKPNYEILRKYQEKHNPNFPTNNLINILENLNQTINDPHYEIGVSFFLTQTLEADIQDIWTMEIEPYLEEYFFDETDKIDQFSWDKIKYKIGFNYDNQ